MLPAGVPDHQRDLGSSGQQLGGDQHQRIYFLRSLHLISPHQPEILNSPSPLWHEYLSAVCRRCPWNHDAAFDLPLLGRAFWRPFKGRVCTAPCQRRYLVFPWGREALLFWPLHMTARAVCPPTRHGRRPPCGPPDRAPPSVSAGLPLAGAGIRTWASCFCTLICCMIEMTQAAIFPWYHDLWGMDDDGSPLNETGLLRG